MTEQEWLECNDSRKMLEFLRGKASDRKLRLFAVACCLGANIVQEDDQPYLVAYLETQDWIEEPHLPLPKFWRDGTWWPEMPFDWASACSKNDDPDSLPLPTRADLLRCVFGPLRFRSVTFDSCWPSSNVKNLAEAIYHEKAFDRMPILADALEDAGCDNADTLNHCRQPGEHVRGCWVLDLALNKK